MLIVNRGKNATEERVKAKLGRLVAFAQATFPDDKHRFEWWSPRVPVGRLTTALSAIEADERRRGRDFRFVINEDYTRRIQELVDVAPPALLADRRAGGQATPDPHAPPGRADPAPPVALAVRASGRSSDRLRHADERT
jgi:hypothetical protein